MQSVSLSCVGVFFNKFLQETAKKKKKTEHVTNMYINIYRKSLAVPLLCFGPETNDSGVVIDG